MRWVPLTVDQLENVDILGLTETELLAHTADLQDEIRWRRRLLSEALTLIEQQREQLARATRLVEFQRQQLQALHERAAA